MARRPDVLTLFQPAVADWFRASFEAPTPPQAQGWPAIARGESTLILAPTGSGKTLSAFLWCINRVMFDPVQLRTFLTVAETLSFTGAGQRLGRRHLERLVGAADRLDQQAALQVARHDGRSAVAAGQLGREHEHVQLDQRQP